ncbi:hypothetical protein [Leifsonia sp. NPDC058230]|uniref:hypothetical protein n=1 Tax=Leifsonia sp. NPDC058230 TaxID=3346391 RepID=UPI0036DC0354
MKDRQTARSAYWLSGASLLVVSGAAVRLIAQFAQSPDRSSRNLAIFLTVLVGAVILCVVSTLIYSVVKVAEASRVKRNVPDAYVFIARVSEDFLETMNSFALADASRPLRRGLANPVLSIDSEAISVWRGIRDPKRAASFPASEVVAIVVEESRKRGFRQSSLVMTVAGTDRELRWRVQKLGLLGLWPVRHKAIKAARARIVGLTIGSAESSTTELGSWDRG